MVDNEQLRAEFSKRLHEACDNAQVRRRGRAVDLQKALKDQGINATTTAIGKWLNGEAGASRANIIALARWLGVRPEWLEYGQGSQELSQDFSLVKERDGVYVIQPKDLAGQVIAELGAVRRLLANMNEDDRKALHATYGGRNSAMVKLIDLMVFFEQQIADGKIDSKDMEAIDQLVRRRNSFFHVHSAQKDRD